MSKSAHRLKSHRLATPRVLVNRFASDGSETPGPDGIRWNLVKRVQAEIAAGLYDTEATWAIAEAALFQRLERD